MKEIFLINGSDSFQFSEPLNATAAFMPVIGNHDLDNIDSVPIFRQEDLLRYRFFF